VAELTDQRVRRRASGAERAPPLEIFWIDELTVAPDIAVFAAHYEEDQVFIAGVRDLARRRRLYMADAALAELAGLTVNFEPRRSTVDEIELVLLIVVVQEALQARRVHDHVDSEGRDAERLANLPEAVSLAELVDRSERVAHAKASLLASVTVAFPRAAVLLVLLAFLSGCGGGGDATTEGTAETPRETFAYETHVPFDIRVTHRLKRPNGTEVRALSLAGPDGSRLTAYLVVPSAKGRRPAVVYLHGAGGSQSDFLGHALQMASRGAIGISLDLPYGSTRATQLPAGVEGVRETVRREIRAVVETRRAIDLLEERRDVDGERIAVVGWSAGARTAAIVAGVDRRAGAYDLMGGGAAPVSEYTARAPAALRGEIERLLRRVDPLAYVARAAPARLLFQNGRRDQVVPEAALKRLATAGSEPKEIRWYDAGHAPTRQVYRESLEWLSKHLRLRR
jgi:uncharacterized protein